MKSEDLLVIGGVGVVAYFVYINWDSLFGAPSTTPTTPQTNPSPSINPPTPPTQTPQGTTVTSPKPSTAPPPSAPPIPPTPTQLDIQTAWLHQQGLAMTLTPEKVNYYYTLLNVPGIALPYQAALWLGMNGYDVSNLTNDQLVAAYNKYRFGR